MRKWMLCSFLFILLSSRALAEGEQVSLAGELQTLVYETGQFDQFTLLTADEDTLSGHPADISIFVLEIEDYCVLFVAKEIENRWNLIGYTRNGVYPETNQNKTLQIRKTDSERFEMSWPGEQYNYYAGGTVNFTRLYQAEFHNNGEHYIAVGETNDAGLQFRSDDSSAYWNPGEYNQITWLNCNPLLFPKSIDMVEKSNAVLNVLNENHFGQDQIRTDLLPKDIKVYVAPDSISRVDTSALFQSDTFSFYGNTDGWYFIGYQDNLSHAYFGYITADAFLLTQRELKISTCCFDSVSLIVNTDTYLTDDPVFSQKCYKILPSGTRIIGLSGWNASYIYAEVTIDGETIRGFVPIRDLALIE